MTDTAVSRPKFHHVNLKTTRLQEMIDWYGEVVGTEVVFQDATGAWLSNDGANHLPVPVDHLLQPRRLEVDVMELGISHCGVRHGSAPAVAGVEVRCSWERRSSSSRGSCSAEEALPKT